jgi:hypothetical protein
MQGDEQPPQSPAGCQYTPGQGCALHGRTCAGRVSGSQNLEFTFSPPKTSPPVLTHVTSRVCTPTSPPQATEHVDHGPRSHTNETVSGSGWATSGERVGVAETVPGGRERLGVGGGVADAARDALGLATSLIEAVKDTVLDRLALPEVVTELVLLGLALTEAVAELVLLGLALVEAVSELLLLGLSLSEVVGDKLEVGVTLEVPVCEADELSDVDGVGI